MSDKFLFSQYFSPFVMFRGGMSLIFPSPSQACESKIEPELLRKMHPACLEPSYILLKTV